MSNAPTAREVRLFCDGELSPPEAAAIEAKLRDDPDAAALAGFERELRNRVATVLKNGSAPPADLRDRIRAALAAADDEVDRPVGKIQGPPRDPVPHRAWWKAPLRANAFAVAASLVLVAGAVLFGIFGQPIDAWRGRPVFDIASEAAAAVAEEHVVVAGGRNAPQWARYASPEVAARELAPYLGDDGCVYELDDMGYTFVGGDTCEVPGCKQGCHLMYKRAGRQAGMITLHVVPRPAGYAPHGTAELNRLPLPTDKIPRSENCRMDVLVWSHGDRCYLLSVCIPGDAEQIAYRMQQTLLAGGSP